MSINIITKPSNVDFSGNGLKYKIGTGYVITDPVKARFYFLKKGTLAVWEGFQVPVPGVTGETITCVAINPTDGWPTAIRYGSVTIDETIDDLQHLYLIDKYYTVWKEDTDKIYFETKEAVEIDTTLIEFISEEVTPSYQFLDPDYVESEGVTGEYEENFSVAVKLRCRHSYTFYYRDEDVCELQLDVDNDGNCELDAGKFLPKNFLDKGSIAYSAAKMAETFALISGFAENKNGSIYPLTFDEIIVLPGKLPFNEYPDWDDSIAIFLSERNKGKIETYPEAFHKFVFYNGNNDSELLNAYCMVDFYFTDGTTASKKLTASTFEPYEFFELNFFISDLLAIYTGDLDVYKIRLNGFWMSGWDQSYIDFEIRAKKFFDKQFLFINSYGFWETVNFQAVTKQSNIIERELFKKHVATGYISDEGEYTQEIRQSYEQFEVETGYREAHELDQIIECLRSREFYEINGTDMIKCEILNTETEVRNDEEDVKNIIITYRRSFDD